MAFFSEVSMCNSPAGSGGQSCRFVRNAANTFVDRVAHAVLPLQIALVLIDEVHLLNEPRGAALEAGCISRIRMVSQLPEMKQVCGEGIVEA